MESRPQGRDGACVSRMRLSDTFRFSLANLVQRKLRTALTMIGVAVGTGAIVLMVSFGVGLQNELVNLFESGESLLMINVIPFKFNLFAGRPRAQKMRPFSDDDLKKIAAVDGVQAAWPDLQLRLRYEVDKSGSTTPVYAIPIESLTQPMRDMLVAGEWWDGKRQDVVVSLELLRKVKARQAGTQGEQHDAPDPTITPAEAQTFLGKELSFVFGGSEGGEGTSSATPPPGLAIDGPDDKGKRRVKCRIVGVYDEVKVGGFDSGVYIPYPFGKLLRVIAPPQWRFTEEGGMQPMKQGEYLSIIAKARSIEEMPRVIERLEALEYNTLTVKDLISVIDKFTLALKAGLGCLGGIGLLVAFFGIVNTMFMAILERTREIGMLKALGARDRDVRRFFLYEAAAIGLLGALAGLGGGWLLSMLMNLLARTFVLKGERFANWHLFQVSFWMAAGSIAFGVLVACAAGLLPAIRASRLDPVTALRHE